MCGAEVSSTVVFTKSVISISVVLLEYYVHVVVTADVVYSWWWWRSNRIWVDGKQGSSSMICCMYFL